MKFIAKEGYVSIGFVLILFILVWIFHSFSWLLFFLLLALLFLFRQVQRDLSCVDEKAILSPLDGRITKIENIMHKDLGECIEISIDNSFYHRGNINAPCKIEPKEIKQRHGLFLDFAGEKSERILILAQVKETQIGIRIFAGSLDRKLNFENSNSILNCGEKMSFSINGCVSLFLPRQTRIYASLGDKVKAGALLGYFS